MKCNKIGTEKKKGEQEMEFSIYTNSTYELYNFSPKVSKLFLSF